MQNFQSYRSCTLGEVDESKIGQELTLCGFVERRRDHGDVVFVDLRDRYGVVQCVFAPDISRNAVETMQPCRKEWVLQVTGTLVERSGGINEKLHSGRVELNATTCQVLSIAETTPFFVADEAEVDEMTRLRYRYLDLRRPVMMSNLAMRHRVSQVMRSYLDEHGFLEVETPMLCRSTPEGARDFLVPSRMNPGHFYALPQSPQIYKQILMVAGVDRYFQIARCFRDEDLRGDRQPEFSQLDVEISYATSDNVMTLMEGLAAKIMKETLGQDVSLPLLRMTFAEGMERFGCDKPDTRFGMELKDATDLLGGSEFGVINSTIEAGGRIRGIAVPATFSRKEIQELEAVVAPFGARGVMPLKKEGEEWKSPLARFFSAEQLAEVFTRCGGEEGNTVLLVAGLDAVTSPSLCRLRLQLGAKLGLIPEGQHDLLWIIDPPLVEWNPDENRFDPVHHPFTAPRLDDMDKLAEDIGAVRADAYDLILDGNEIAGGSVRIHDRTMQRQVFERIGLDQAAIEEKFGFMLEAFRYGVPPHAGMAFGLDRLIMLLAGGESIRDVMAFPKTTSGGCLMTAAPSAVDNQQLADLHICLRKTDEE